MAFPVPSETFASNEVLALHRAGADVSIHCLRPVHANADQLLIERGLTTLQITHNSLRASLQGLWIGFKKPKLILAFLSWVFQHTWKYPSDFIKSLILVPRTLDIFELINQKNPDVVHLYWSHYPSLLAHLVQTYRPDIVVSLSFIAYDLTAEYACTAPVTCQARLVQTVTKANFSAIEKLGISQNQISLCYQGVNFRQIPARKPKILRRIISVGRLVPEKGFEDTLRIFSLVLSKWHDASLVILGDGSDRERLEKLAQSLGIAHAVSFCGHVCHDQVFEEMATAEIFLFMSKYVSERLPNVVKEAMACYCLPIVTETPGIEELIYHGQNGYIVTQGNINTAAEIINEAFANPLKNQQVVEAAYSHVRANFDIDQQIQNLRDRWQKALATKTSVMN